MKLMFVEEITQLRNLMTLRLCEDNHSVPTSVMNKLLWILPHTNIATLA